MVGKELATGLALKLKLGIELGLEIGYEIGNKLELVIGIKLGLEQVTVGSKLGPELWSWLGNIYMGVWVQT